MNISPADPQTIAAFQHVTLVGYQKPIWATYSGANGIMDVIPHPHIRHSRPLPALARVPFLLPKRAYLMHQKHGYDIDSAYLEYQVARHWIHQRNHIYHFLSGEGEYFFSGLLKTIRSNLLVCTFHNSINKYIRVVSNHRAIRHLDAAVVVGSTMQEFFGAMLGPERVWFVPLGIHIDYWKPADPPHQHEHAPPCRVLFVGTHLRDFEVLRSVIQQVQRHTPDIHFELVMSGDDAAALIGLRHLTIHTRIDDAALLRLYQNCDMMICPLLECTASNSILESLACGLPLVVTQTGSVMDYVSPACALLTPPADADAMTSAILHLAESPQQRTQMAHAARQRALEFDWRVIAQRFAVIYRTLRGDA